MRDVMTHRTRHTQATALLGSLSGSSLDRLHTLADTLVDSLWGDVYAPQGPVPKDDLWRSCHGNMGNHLKALNGAGPPSAVLLETARATGMRRARQHCPLGWVQRAWRIGGQVIWEDFAGQAGVDDADELRRLVEAASRVWQITEEFSAEMSATYQSVEQELAGPRDSRFVVIVTEQTSRATMRDLIQTLHLEGLRTVWHFRAGLNVGIVALDGDTPDILLGMLRCALPGRAGLSPVLRKLSEIPEGRRMAELAMNTVPPGGEGVVALDDRLTDALLISSPQLAQRLIEVTFGPLLDLPAAECRELLDTAGAWINSAGSAVQAARTLYCHRNTVVNRLARIHRLTGVNLADASCWPQVALALSALQYQQNRGQNRTG